jgi:hypothetical protein
MSKEMTGIFITVLLFGGMLLGMEVGRRMGLRRSRKEPEESKAGGGAVEGTVFALLGLLLAFTFSGAASRFGWRRDLIVEEANAIGTAYLRLDLLPEAEQPALREAFRQYLDARLEALSHVSDESAFEKDRARVNELQAQIWEKAMVAVRLDERPQVAPLVVPALNEMFDISTTRMAAFRTHVPEVILATLFALELLASVLAGYGMGSAKGGQRFHKVIFAAVIAMSTYVIMDLEFPRFGIIRLDAADRVLSDLRESIK